MMFGGHRFYNAFEIDYYFRYVNYFQVLMKVLSLPIKNSKAMQQHYVVYRFFGAGVLILL